MKLPSYVISNPTKQAVSINYQAGAASVVGDVDQLKHGLLSIAPGQKVTILQSRVNYAQLHTLYSQNLITLAEGYL
jgi:hypothetical protein